MSPDNGGAYLSLGAVYINMGRYDDAIAALKKAIELRPYYDSFSNLGMVYLRTGRADEAIPILEKAVTLGRDYRVTGNLARAYFWKANYAQATKMYERAIKEGEAELAINPRSSDVHILLGRYYSMIGRKPEAVP